MPQEVLCPGGTDENGVARDPRWVPYLFTRLELALTSKPLSRELFAGSDYHRVLVRLSPLVTDQGH